MVKPRVEIFSHPLVIEEGGGKVAIVGRTSRSDPDEGIMFWGYRPQNAGVFAYVFLDPEAKWVPCQEYRPAYRKAVAAFSGRDVAWAAGLALGWAGERPWWETEPPDPVSLA